MPQVTLPDHQQKFRTYVDPLDQYANIFNASTNNKNEIFLLGELLGPTALTHLTTPNAFQTGTLTAPGSQITPLIIKFDSLGGKQWGSFFGKGIYGRGITTDDIGNIYLCGFYPGTTPPQSYVPVTPGAFKTQELPFSITVGSQTFNFFAGDGYLAKFSPSGALLWCTLYGGQGGEYLENIAVDKDYNIYVTGSTTSGTDISTPGSFKENFVPAANNAGNNIGLLVKFDSAGHRLWGTYYGGDNTTNTTPSQIAVDSSGNVIIAGSTNSHIGIATSGSHLADYSIAGSNQYRLFVAKFDSRGTRLWGSYYGSSQPVINGVNINLSGLLTKGDNIYFTGTTNMIGDIASTGSFMEQNAGGFDAFLVALYADGTRKWGSYFGGSGADVVSHNCIRLATDKKALYFMGRTNSSSGISSNNAYNQGEMISNPYISKMGLEGNRIWSSYVSVHTNLNNLSDAALPTDNSIALVTTNEGALYTLIRQPKQGCFPLGTPSVFQDTAGGTASTYLLTKYLDTSFKPIIITPPVVPVVPLSFEVFPNPSNGQFTIRTTSTKPYDYIIYAAEGKRIKANITTGYYTSVNITSSAAGIYIVRATDRTTGQVYHRKILKR